MTELEPIPDLHEPERLEGVPANKFIEGLKTRAIAGFSYLDMCTDNPEERNFVLGEIAVTVVDNATGISSTATISAEGMERYEGAGCSCNG